MSRKTKLEKTEEKLERLKRSFLATGPMLQGSILERLIRRQDPKRPGRTKTYGPYYQWTRKIAGRTVIRNLSASQAKVYARAIRENRRHERIVAKMRKVSLELLELTTQGVEKRKRRKQAKNP